MRTAGAIATIVRSGRSAGRRVVARHRAHELSADQWRAAGGPCGGEAGGCASPPGGPAHPRARRGDGDRGASHRRAPTKGERHMRRKSLAGRRSPRPSRRTDRLSRLVVQGEVAALNVLQEALNAKGHTWKDLAIPHNSGVNVSIVNLVTGGDPPERVRHLRPRHLPRPRRPRARARPDRLLQRDRRHRQLLPDRARALDGRRQDGEGPAVPACRRHGLLEQGRRRQGRRRSRPPGRASTR